MDCRNGAELGGAQGAVAAAKVPASVFAQQEVFMDCVWWWWWEMGTDLICFGSPEAKIRICPQIGYL